MATLTVSIRTDVLAGITRELLGREMLAEVIEDLAYTESGRRFADTRAEAPRIDCRMTSPTTPVAVELPGGPLRLLTDSLSADETLDGLVTALLIDEYRYRRTGMYWPLESANEPLMPTDAARVDALIHQTTTEGDHTMYTITADVRADVLAAFDACLDAWEDRSEELAALIHLEDEVRAEGTESVGAWLAASLPYPMATIEIELDASDWAALRRTLSPGEDEGALLTCLMLNAVNGRSRRARVTHVGDPLLTLA